MNSALFSLSTGVKSLVEELWDYFVENYLNASAAYPNLGMQNNPLISLPAILAGLLFGTMIAVCFATYDNFTVGSFVRKMLERIVASDVSAAKEAQRRLDEMNSRGE